MLKVSAAAWKDFLKGDEPLALFSFEEGLAPAARLAPGVRKSIFAAAKEEGFSGKAGETVCFRASDGTKDRRFLLAGLGKKASSDREGIRRAAAALYKASRKRFAALGFSPHAETQAAAEGILLASYEFSKYRKPEEGILLNAVSMPCANAGERTRCRTALLKASLAAEAVAFARDLVNTAPSDKTPLSLAEQAQTLAGGGVTVRVIGKEEAEGLGMGSFLGVARGSVHPPALAHLAYKPKGAKRKVALVGKGITFDSGGLSLKPPQGMETMKMDMAGAALVLGVFKVLARWKPKVEVHGYAVMTYNLPGGDAYKPGDVLRARNGKTIEVLNTDAEGRLVLADALCLAAEEEPDAILDFATLTGAVTVALGSSVAGAMTNDKALLGRLSTASRLADEPLWELPLPKEYEENIKSKVADLQNIGKVRGEAGTIIGGLFLREFVGKVPWVHLDIAGTAWTDSDKPCCPAGGTGAGVRTVLEYLSAL